MYRPKHFKPYEQMTEIVPGVFIDRDNGVFIVDHEGEVVSWDSDAWQSDEGVATAVVTAIALATKHGAQRVRENMRSGGIELAAMIDQTRRDVEYEL